MIFGYNTNGLAHHRLEDAFDLLVAAGYGGVALTLDVSHRDLPGSGAREWARVAALLRERRLHCVVETGGRFVLDPARKHWPNLCSTDDAAATRRLAFYRQACQCAASLGATVVSLWSGAADDAVPATAAASKQPPAVHSSAFQRLLTRLDQVLDIAVAEGVRVAFEPEPGMLIDDLVAYRLLRKELGRDDLGTTLDLGHLVVDDAEPLGDSLREFADSLINVHLDDARPGVHEHLPFGQGNLDLQEALRVLQEIGYSGLASVELSRDSHRGAEAVRESMQALRGAR